MIRMTLIFIGFAHLAASLFAIDWTTNFTISKLGWEEPVLTVFGKNGSELLFGRSFNRLFVRNDYKDIQHTSDLRLNSDGFYTISIFGHESVAIFGGNYFFFHDLKDNRYSMYRPDMDYLAFVKKYRKIADPDTGYYPESLRYESIKQIIVPDILTEITGGKKTVYSTDDMKRYYAWKRNDFIVCNPDAIPWATRKDPVGMSIEVEFGAVKSITSGFLLNKSDHIVILNGYVNPLQRNLYKANRRIKTLLVESLDSPSEFSIRVQFEDDVQFRRIPFPDIAAKIKLTILAYYEGEKYKDLCVQLIGTDFNLSEDLDYYFDYNNDAILWIR